MVEASVESCVRGEAMGQQQEFYHQQLEALCLYRDRS